MLGVANSYTVEASFGGSELGSRMSTHFSVQDYESMGRTFCETLLDFCDEDPSKERLRSKIVTRLLKEGSNADEPTNIDLSDYSRYIYSIPLKFYIFCISFFVFLSCQNGATDHDHIFLSQR